MSRKPVVTAVDNIFGEIPEERLNGDGNPRFDPFEIPGYSDRRRQRDIALARKAKGLDYNPAHLKPLDFRLHAVKTVNARDLPDKRKAAQRQAQGYRPLQWDEARKLGIDLSKSSWERAADGTIRMSEYTVFIADRKTAARNLADVDAANQNQLMQSLARAPSVAGQVQQMAPQIEEPPQQK